MLISITEGIFLPRSSLAIKVGKEKAFIIVAIEIWYKCDLL
jgi:hypothetical protein